MPTVAQGVENPFARVGRLAGATKTVVTFIEAKASSL